MNYNLHIENLGAIQEADITITPLTILAGENGTGKSFVTKFLYSVLNVTILDNLSNEIIKSSKNIEKYIKKVEEGFKYNFNESEHLSTIEELRNNIYEFFNITENINTKIIPDFKDHDFFKLRRSIEIYDKEIFLALKNEDNELEHSKIFHSDKKITDLSLTILKFSSEILSYELNLLLMLIDHPKAYYDFILQDKIKDELKANFQISKVSSLIKNSFDMAVFEINGLINIKIHEDDTLEISYDENYLTNSNEINRVVFFESPLYWKILSLVNSNKDNISKYRSDLINNERLSGIPKHFLDLEDLVFANFLDDTPSDFIMDAANSLEEKLRGKFKIANEDLNFETQEGQIISKSLISFGMTNLGILQTVLSKNIINIGSFVFIDEPESNLHPEWQAILASVLVNLAKNGVYVIITTHSSDILKAFDVITQEQKVEEDLSTYYFKPNGNLLELDDLDATPIEQARRELLKTYEKLLVRGYLL